MINWLRSVALGVLGVSVVNPAAVGDAIVDATLDALESTDDWPAAVAAIDARFDDLVLGVDPKHPDDLVEADVARRLLALLEPLEPAQRRRVLPRLRALPALARTLALVRRPEDEPADVVGLIERLLEERGAAVADHPDLAVALAVVHDRPLRRRINENVAVAGDPVGILDHLVGHERRLLFGLRDVPAEVLVWVVDTTSSPREQAWALERYAGDAAVGRRFFDVAYDLDHLRTGAPKRVTVEGWNLPGILEFGGVCADQAYFAVEVGKAIGVPTAYVVGRSGEVGHAWVGFLQSDGRRAWWNFDVGRYDAYRGVRGNVVDPQTRRTIPDSELAILAAYVSVPRDDRAAAIALTDAAIRLGSLHRERVLGDGAAPDHVGDDDTDLDAQLALLEAALRRCPGAVDAWRRIRQLAAEGRLSLAQKKEWAAVLHRLCARRYPDFYLEVLAPMVSTVADPDEQNRLWNAAFAAFGDRADLAAAVRMAQADLWLARGEPRKAGQCYENVIDRFANAGPFVLDALAAAETLLRDAGDGRRLLALYDRAWSRLEAPRQMAGVFTQQSNWYRVGVRYAELLDEAGLVARAADVRAALSRP